MSMAPKEALWRVETCMDMADNEAFEILSDLVNKATPVFPTNLFEDNIYVELIGLCPLCKKEVISSHNFCYNCGQALDWSDEK